MRDALLRIRAVVTMDLRLLRRDPAFVIIFTVMPIAYMAFSRDAYAAALALRYPGEVVNGAEHVVPGSAVMFSGFMVGNLGFAVFREHSWSTWDRLRASALSTPELLVGKAVTPICVLGFQLTALLAGGAALFGLRLSGSLAAFALVAAALALMEVTLGFALLAICRSVLQLNAVTNLGAMLLAGLGGAVTPLFLLPGWARTVAPATPAYWAMRGFSAVTLEDGGLGDVLVPVGVLLAYSLAFVAVASFRFRAEDAKVGGA